MVKVIRDPELAKRSTAYQALVRSGAIYKMDESRKGLAPQRHLKERQKYVKPLAEEYFAWVRAVLGSRLSKGATASSQIYFRVFLDDEKIPIDNSRQNVALLYENKIYNTNYKNFVIISKK